MHANDDPLFIHVSSIWVQLKPHLRDPWLEIERMCICKHFVYINGIRIRILLSNRGPTRGKVITVIHKQ